MVVPLPAQTRDSFLLYSIHTSYGAQPVPYSKHAEVYPQQQSGQDVWLSSFSTKVKNAWSFISTPTYAFNGMQ